MSEQLLYVVMGGLDGTMRRTTATANNLANRNTTAFKAQRPVFQSLALMGQGLPDRVTVAASEESANFQPGPIEETGRDLDVAVKGSGWIAVQAADGQIALTRNGALAITANGVLETSDGHPVLGRDLAPIALPPLQKVTIGADGTISGALLGQSPDQIVSLDRIMLVDPPPATLQRRSDGLFQDTSGTPPPDAAVQLQVGALEGSNADPVSMMMSMLEDTRLFEIQTQLLRMSTMAGQGQNSPLTLT
jgi:flagellar basal-body rod protein FlgF